MYTYVICWCCYTKNAFISLYIYYLFS